jgi:hypothetical protein
MIFRAVMRLEIGVCPRFPNAAACRAAAFGVVSTSTLGVLPAPVSMIPVRGG